MKTRSRAALQTKSTNTPIKSQPIKKVPRAKIPVKSVVVELKSSPKTPARVPLSPSRFSLGAEQIVVLQSLDISPIQKDWFPLSPIISSHSVQAPHALDIPSFQEPDVISDLGYISDTSSIVPSPIKISMTPKVLKVLEPTGTEEDPWGLIASLENFKREYKEPAPKTIRKARKSIELSSLSENDEFDSIDSWEMYVPGKRTIPVVPVKIQTTKRKRRTKEK